MKYLLRELYDLERWKNYIPKQCYFEYKKYLNEKILLKEFTPEHLYTVFINNKCEKSTIDQRIEQISSHFKNTTNYEYEPKIGIRRPTFRTHLQLNSKNFCTKEEFEKEFLEYNFDDNSKAIKYLKCITNLFNKDSWLIIS